jgi:predicted lipoprotein
MTLRRLISAAALLAFAAPAAAQTVEKTTPAEDKALVETAIAGHIRPGYEALAEAFAALQASVEARCAAADTPESPEVAAAFEAAVVAWGHVQHLRFGPIHEEDRYLRVSFWPDPRDFVGRHLGELEQSLGDLPLTAASLEQMSVAVQGLPALERILSEPPEELTLDRCALAEAIAGNLNGIAAATAEEWRPGAEYPALLTEPGPENPLYRNPREAALELFKALGGGLQALEEQKLKPVLGENADAARPGRAPYHRSALAMADLEASVAGLRGFYLDGGFSAAVAERGPDVDAMIRQHFEQAIATLDRFEAPLAVTATDAERRQPWRYVQLLVHRAREEVSGPAGALLGYVLGFNAFDGD